MTKLEYKINLEPFINREYPKSRGGLNKSIDVDEKGCPIPPTTVDVESYLNDNPKYGQIDKSFIYLPILITQSFNNIGLYTDEDFIEMDNLINESFDVYTRKSGLPVENYFTYNEYFVTGQTSSALDVVKSYNQSNPYIIGFNMNPLPSQGFTGVISISDESIKYVIDGQINNVGQYVDGTGVIMETFSTSRLVEDPITKDLVEIPLTTFRYKVQGLRDYNTSLKALIHEEKYLGIVEKPIVNNDVLVDRGTVNVMERHLKLSEVDSVEQLQRYGQGFFRVQVV